MNDILLLAFLFVIIKAQTEVKIIVLPFKTYKKPYSSSESFNISRIVNNHLYTEIEISNQILAATFSSDEYGFYMTSENCIEQSNYIIQKSKSFTNLTNFTESKEGFASERMLLYRDIDLKKKQYGYYTRMRINSYNNNIQCAIFGLKMESDVYEFIQSFIKTFKLNQNINNYKWTLKYKSNDEGLLVLGDSPIEYDLALKNKNYTEYKGRAIKYKNYFNFAIKFDEVIINKKALNVNKEIRFYHELGVLLVDQKYYDNITDIFFTKYLSNKICERKWVYEKYGYTVCYANKFTDNDIKSFPTIYFKHREMDYIFELNYKDLFSKEADGNIYFLIIFDLNHDGIKFGKPFLKKYPLTVDNDQKTVSLFIKNEDGVSTYKEDNSLIYILTIVLILFLIVLGLLIYFGYKLLKKGKAKKRANELDEDYEYITDGNIDNDTNKKNNQPFVNTKQAVEFEI